METLAGFTVDTMADVVILRDDILGTDTTMSAATARQIATRLLKAAGDADNWTE